jgi:hypothetical protein
LLDDVWGSRANITTSFGQDPRGNHEGRPLRFACFLVWSLTHGSNRRRIAERQRTKEVAKEKNCEGQSGHKERHSKISRHTVEKALRIPKAIIEQNAGKECTDKESAKFVGVSFNGPYKVEVSSAIKYGFLDRPMAGYIEPTERARKAIRPQKPGDEIDALRAAVLDAPDISEVYKHYRGEYLPEPNFFEHALVDKFSIPTEKVPEFIEIF